jgi:Icc-related predicted phosphoesterase
VSSLRILSFSDLHLEFRPGAIDGFDRLDGDVLVLAGDIVNLMDVAHLDDILNQWRKPVIYVIGNHELYTRRPMNFEISNFKSWLAENHPHVHLLCDEAVTIDGVNFYGGTMWTDFNGSNPVDMQIASEQINDFELIYRTRTQCLTPEDTVTIHSSYKGKLLEWLVRGPTSQRVVVSYHAPVINPATKYGTSPLQPAFNSLDMVPLIEQFQPNLWIYGHTHECDDQMLGKTRIISNQLGYPQERGEDFDPTGKPVDLC